MHHNQFRSEVFKYPAISPPAFGLNVHRLAIEGNRAIVVEVPASVDRPHLIYNDDYFAAPVGDDSDTVWIDGGRSRRCIGLVSRSVGKLPRRWIRCMARPEQVEILTDEPGRSRLLILASLAW